MPGGCPQREHQSSSACAFARKKIADEWHLRCLYYNTIVHYGQHFLPEHAPCTVHAVTVQTHLKREVFSRQCGAFTMRSSVFTRTLRLYGICLKAFRPVPCVFLFGAFICGRVLKSSLRNRLCLSAKPFPLLFGQEGGALLKYSAVVIIERIQGLRSQAGGLNQG